MSDPNQSWFRRKRAWIVATIGVSILAASGTGLAWAVHRARIEASRSVDL